MKKLKLIGYWREKQVDPIKSVPHHLRKYLDPSLWKPYTPSNKYPWPADFINPEFWQNLKCKDQVIKYLQSGQTCNHYRGFSRCRICGECLGTCERTDGIWVWPDKLDHYISNHDVVLPRPFINTVIVNCQKIVPADEDSFVIDKDDTFWINWSKNNIG